MKCEIPGCVHEAKDGLPWCSACNDFVEEFKRKGLTNDKFASLLPDQRTALWQRVQDQEVCGFREWFDSLSQDQMNAIFCFVMGHSSEGNPLESGLLLTAAPMLAKIGFQTILLSSLDREDI